MTETKSGRAVLEAASTVLAANPGASMSEIAEQAEVGRATLYRHFASREELINALALRSLDELEAATAHIESAAQSGRHAVELLFEAMAPLGARYQFLMNESSIEADPAFAERTRAYEAEMIELFEYAKSEGSISPDVPTAWAAAAFDALLYAAWAAVADGSVAPNDAGAWASRTLFEGLSVK